MQLFPASTESLRTIQTQGRGIIGYCLELHTKLVHGLSHGSLVSGIGIPQGVKGAS